MPILALMVLYIRLIMEEVFAPGQKHEASISISSSKLPMTFHKCFRLISVWLIRGFISDYNYKYNERGSGHSELITNFRRKQGRPQLWASLVFISYILKNSLGNHLFNNHIFSNLLIYPYSSLQ